MKKIFFMMVFLGILIATSSFAEELTITTYYPAPFGVYEELRAGEFYGYDPNTYNLVEVLDVSTGSNPIYYGVDPEAISDGVGFNVPKDGSFLRQLYVGSGYTASGPSGWPLDNRVALYVNQPTSASEWNVGTYSRTTGQDSFGVFARIGYSANSAPSYGLYADNMANGTANPQFPHNYTCAIKGITAANTPSNRYGVGVFGELARNPVTGVVNDGIAVYANAWDDNHRAIIARGRVGIGTEEPEGKLHLDHDVNEQWFMFLDAHGSASDANITFSRSFGTQTGPATLYAPAGLGSITWSGYDGSNYIPAARISGAADNANGAQTGSNNVPGKIVFSTTDDTNSSPTERMVINNAGDVGIGTTVPNHKLEVAGEVQITPSGSSTGPIIYADISGNLIIKLGNNL